MSRTLELLSTITHGTPEGYLAGCRGSATSCGAATSCSDVYVRYQGDWSFRKRVKAGENPLDIIAEQEAEAEAVRIRDAAANRSRVRSERRKHAARVKRATAVKREPKPRRRFVNRDEVARLHGLGWTDQRIATELGVTPSAISTIRRVELKLPRVGFSRLSAEHKLAIDEQRRIITEMNTNGSTDRQIATAIGRTHRYVTQMRNRMGLAANVERRLKHGTNAGYQQGCRCDGCRAACAAYQREYRARKAAA